MMPGGDPAKSPSEYIYVARNPKDTLVSFYLHCRAYKGMVFCDRPWDWFFEQTLTGEIPFGSWFDHVLGWWKHKGKMFSVDLEETTQKLVVRHINTTYNILIPFMIACS